MKGTEYNVSIRIPEGTTGVAGRMDLDDIIWKKTFVNGSE